MRRRSGSDAPASRCLLLSPQLPSDRRHLIGDEEGCRYAEYEVEPEAFAEPLRDVAEIRQVVAHLTHHVGRGDELRIGIVVGVALRAEADSSTVAGDNLNDAVGDARAGLRSEADHVS